MTLEIIIGLAVFAFVTSVTPGPNNLMLIASGTNFGLRRTVPHWLGVSIGFVILASVVGLGASRVLETYPAVQLVMRVLCIGYLLWLAWKVASANQSIEGQNEAAPLSFFQAACFQWVNPKVWAMALTAISLYAPNGKIAEIVVVASIFGVVNFPAVGLWVIAGTKLQAVLREPIHMRVFNFTMAALLIASLAPIFI